MTILETLMNADLNLQTATLSTIQIAQEQLHNAVSLLNKGYSLNAKVEFLIDFFRGIDRVPDKET